MACAFHPDVQEVTLCHQCQKPLCPDCFVVLEGRNLCGLCKNTAVRQLERGQLLFSAGRGPSPWERERSFATLVETTKAVLLTPAEFFRGLSHDGSGHITFLLAWPASVIGNMVTQVGMALFAGGGKEILAALGMAALMTGLTALLIPVQLLIAAYVFGGITHLGLRLFGGANARFEATVRTVAYCQAAMIFSFVPFLGQAVGGIWGLVAQVIGLREMHETTTGRVLAAIFLPLTVCCGLISLIFIIPLALSGRH
jgi:hypothetical protein